MTSRPTAWSEPASPSIAWITNLRACACLMVVGLHVAAWYVLRMDRLPLGSWQIGNIVDALTRSCVPIFFMISGYLFLREKQPAPRHVVRLLAALVFYTSLYRIPGWVSGTASPMDDFVQLLSRPLHYHLWFFYAQFAIYLIAMTMRARETSLTVLVALLCLMFLINPRLESVTPLEAGLLSHSMDGTMIYYLLYTLLGAELGARASAGRPLTSSAIGLATFAAASAGIALLTSNASLSKGAFVHTYYSYANPLVILAAVGLFTAVSGTSRSPRIVSLIARLSLPIYGLHVLPLTVIGKLGMMGNVSAVIELPVVFASVVLISIGMAACLSRIDRRGYLS